MGENRLKKETDHAIDECVHWNGRNPPHAGDVYRKGIREGLECAAQWHDRHATSLAKAIEDGLMPDSRQQCVCLHQDSAAAIRALKS